MTIFSARVNTDRSDDVTYLVNRLTLETAHDGEEGHGVDQGSNGHTINEPLEEGVLDTQFRSRSRS